MDEKYNENSIWWTIYEILDFNLMAKGLEAMDKSLLTYDENTWLNNYHRTVFYKLSPYLQDEELEYLR